MTGPAVVANPAMRMENGKGVTQRRTIELTLGVTGCRLSLDAGPRSASFAASNIEDAVHDAVLAAVDLTRGRVNTGFLWRVDQSGVFVDIHLGFKRATLVVHEMKDSEWSISAWYPERAQPLFRLAATPRRFIEDFLTAVTSLPHQAAAGGERPLWGRTLPEQLIAEVARYIQLGTHTELYDGREPS